MAGGQSELLVITRAKEPRAFAWETRVLTIGAICVSVRNSAHSPLKLLKTTAAVAGRHGLVPLPGAAVTLPCRINERDLSEGKASWHKELMDAQDRSDAVLLLLTPLAVLLFHAISRPRRTRTRWTARN